MSTFYTSQALAPEVVTYNHSFGCSSPGCVAKVSPGIDIHRLYRFFPLSIAFSKLFFFQVPYKKKALLNSNYQMRYFIAKVIFDSQFRITGRSFEQASAPCLQRCFTGPIASLRRFSVSAALRIFRDIPRDPSRTCALDVDIYVTDFTNNAEHANPEVVDSWQKSQLQVEIFTSRPSRKSQHF